MKERGHIPDDFHPHFEAWQSRWPNLKWAAEDEKQRVDLLRKGRKARLRLFSFSDPVGMICVLAVLAIALSGPTALFVQNIIFRVRAQRERLQVAKSRIESFQEFSFDLKTPKQHDPLPSDRKGHSRDLRSPRLRRYLIFVVGDASRRRILATEQLSQRYSKRSMPCDE